MRPKVVACTIITLYAIAFAVAQIPEADPYDDRSPSIIEPPGPVPALYLPCRITQVVDGDTIEVEMSLQARVRLIDCWAPELSTPDGALSSQNLQKIALRKEAILHVPITGQRLDRLFTFGRVLGHVYLLGDRETLSAMQVRTGHATRTRNE